MGPEDAALRAEWARVYRASLRPNKPGTVPKNAQRELGSCVQSCTYRPAPTETKFQQDFSTWTNGLSVQDSIDLYKAQTGKTLTEAEVEILFTDADKAKEKLMADKDLHTVYRSILNNNAPTTKADAIKASYTQPTFLGSRFLGNWYHDPWKNSKYISPSGHLESVFDEGGNLVSSNDYKGTFNFFGPDQKAAHKAADVDPFNEWGN